jgi:uncharacterized short protein YbdD (DUF466 family)
MKRNISLLFLILLFGGVSIFAQDSDKPTVLVFSQNMVKMSDMGKVNQMVDSIFTPILNGLVDEGMLSGWGQLNHAWGDEWNLNFWYSAKDLDGFNKFWAEYVKRVREKHPDAFSSTVKYFQSHKDNIYSIRKSYSGK